MTTHGLPIKSHPDSPTSHIQQRLTGWNTTSVNNPHDAYHATQNEFLEEISKSVTSIGSQSPVTPQLPKVEQKKSSSTMEKGKKSIQKKSKVLSVVEVTTKVLKNIVWDVPPRESQRSRFSSPLGKWDSSHRKPKTNRINLEDPYKISQPQNPPEIASRKNAKPRYQVARYAHPQQSHIPRTISQSTFNGIINQRPDDNLWGNFATNRSLGLDLHNSRTGSIDIVQEMAQQVSVPKNNNTAEAKKKPTIKTKGSRYYRLPTELHDDQIKNIESQFKKLTVCNQQFPRFKNWVAPFLQLEFDLTSKKGQDEFEKAEYIHVHAASADKSKYLLRAVDDSELDEKGNFKPTARYIDLWNVPTSIAEAADGCRVMETLLSEYATFQESCDAFNVGGDGFKGVFKGRVRLHFMDLLKNIPRSLTIRYECVDYDIQATVHGVIGIGVEAVMTPTINSNVRIFRKNERSWKITQHEDENTYANFLKVFTCSSHGTEE